MVSFFLLFIGLLGILIGSMLNALVWRTHEERSMMEKHSVCPHCQHPLAWYDLIPVLSFAFLKGKCRYCHRPISWQYPLVEVATAVLFVASAIQVVGCRFWIGGNTCLPPNTRLDNLASASHGVFWALAQTTYNLQPWTFVALLVSLTCLSLLIALFVYDLKWGLLPNQWTLGGAGLMLVATSIAALLHQPLLWQAGTNLQNLSTSLGGIDSRLPTPDALLATLLSGAAAAAFFALIIVVSEKILKKTGMGWGDVKLALFMGLLLGYPGIIIALYAAFILGAVISLILIAGKRKKLGQTIPFGPFLVAGTLLALWLTPLVVAWYSQFIL